MPQSGSIPLYSSAASDVYKRQHESGSSSSKGPTAGRPISRFGSTRQVTCLLYTSPSPRDGLLSRMPSSECHNRDLFLSIRRQRQMCIRDSMSLVRPPRRGRRPAGRYHGLAAHARLPVSYTHLRAHETDSYLVCRHLNATIGIYSSLFVGSVRCV